MAFPLYPLVVWAALRTGARIMTGAIVAVIASIALWATVHDFGPFHGALAQRPHDRLCGLTAVLAITGLVLSAMTVSAARTRADAGCGASL